MGLRNSTVLCFDCNQKYFSAECDLSGGTGNFIGLAKYEKLVKSCDCHMTYLIHYFVL